jgi:putative Mg2+ transporter-C (MgtC) family protein
MLSFDLGLQLALAVRLLVAAVLGAVIGFEREIHDHPAGMRTHLLVSLGSAAFTVLSIYAFTDPSAPAGSAPVDTSRVAAQVVTGIGFLGAGAIIKYGTSVRGLTTAASLWATAAVGMAVGAGWWAVALVGTAIVVFSLWPLNIVVNRIRGQGVHPIRIRLHAPSLDALGDVTRAVAGRRVEIGEVNTQRQGKGSYEIELQVKVPANVAVAELIEMINAVPNVEIVETDAGGE